jgi:hypothetical protein
VFGAGSNNPQATMVTSELNTLIDKLVANNGTGTGRTALVVQDACDAALGSAVLEMQ